MYLCIFDNSLGWRETSNSSTCVLNDWIFVLFDCILVCNVSLSSLGIVIVAIVYFFVCIVCSKRAFDLAGRKDTFGF